MALPGGYAEAHESFGCVPDNFIEFRAQTQLPEALYSRMGFACYAGSTWEPGFGFLKASSYTNSSQRLREKIMAGYTHIEASLFDSWYWLRGPITFIGDPLSRPFARIPIISFTGPANGAVVTGTSVAVNVNTFVTGGSILRTELYIDDVLVSSTTGGGGLTYAWNTTSAVDGRHKLYAVAYAEGHDTAYSYVLQPNIAVINVTSSNAARMVAITSPVTGTSYASETPIPVIVDGAGTFDQLRILINGAVVVTTNAFGTVNIPAASVPFGAGQIIEAELLLAGAVVCSSAAITVDNFEKLTILTMSNTVSSSSFSMTNYSTNIDFHFQSGIIVIKASNIYNGAKLYVDGIEAALAGYYPSSVNYNSPGAKSPVATVCFKLPAVASAGVKMIVLSNLDAGTAITNAMFYVPVQTHCEIYPRNPTLRPGEKLRLFYKIFDQNGNWLPTSYTINWNSVFGGSLTVAEYTAGEVLGEYYNNISVGGFSTNLRINIYNTAVNFTEHFTNTMNWGFGNTAYPWTASGGVMTANNYSSENCIYLLSNKSCQTNPVGVVEVEGRLTSTANGFFGVRVLGELNASAALPYKRNYGYGISVYTNRVYFHYQTAESTSGAYASVSRNLATNVWYKVRASYNDRFCYLSVFTNNVVCAETNFYYMNTPFYTNIVKLVGNYGVQFSNFKMYDWDSSGIDYTAPSVSLIPSFTTNAPFILDLGVDEPWGYWSTNGSMFYQFGMAGTSVSIMKTTTVWHYGRDALGNNSTTNSNTYVIDVVSPTLSGVPANCTTNLPFNVNLAVDENWGYWSTNGTMYTSFTTNGTVVSIDQTTTLWYYGCDTWGNASVTNSYTYTFDLPSVPNFTMKNFTIEQLALENKLRFAYTLAKDCTEPAIVDITWSYSGSNLYMPLIGGLSGTISFTAGGTYSNDWLVVPGFDTARRYDFCIVSTVGTKVSAPLILTNVDLSRMFTVANTIDKACAVNSPYRGEIDGIIFANITRDTSAKIYTLSGRLVASIAANPLGRLVWTVTTVDGKRAAPGIYLCLLVTPSSTKTIKVMVLR